MIFDLSRRISEERKSALDDRNQKNGNRSSCINPGNGCSAGVWSGIACYRTATARDLFNVAGHIRARDVGKRYTLHVPDDSDNPQCYRSAGRWFYATYGFLEILDVCAGYCSYLQLAGGG